MRRLLLSMAVVVVALVVPGGSHPSPYAGSSAPTEHYSQIPALEGDSLVTPPSTTPSPKATPDEPPANEPAVSVAAAPTTPVPHGTASSSVVDGTTTTPAPGNCNGTSMSHDSSDFGRSGRSRSHMRTANCPSDTSESCDDANCGD